MAATARDFSRRHPLETRLVVITCKSRPRFACDFSGTGTTARGARFARSGTIASRSTFACHFFGPGIIADANSCS